MQASAAEEQLRAAEDEVVRAVRMAWLDVNNTRQQLQTTGELVRHATKAYDLAAARYQAGLSSMVELTDAQLSLVSAQIAQANARHDLLARQAGLDYEIGATLF
jgi:outer membrane protein